MIAVEKISKKYGKKKILDNVTFIIEKNGVFGFLGPNGAGKTTLFKILSGLKYPDKGNVTIFGLDLKENGRKIRENIGYLPENSPLDSGITVESFLKMYASFKGLKKGKREDEVERVISLCSLEKVRNKITDTLSKGYRQRAGIAQSLLKSPGILLLDEPLSGLDPEQLVSVREVVLQAGERSTVIISSHNLRELELISNKVFIMTNGRIAGEVPVSEGVDLESLYLEIIGRDRL